MDGAILLISAADEPMPLSHALAGINQLLDDLEAEEFLKKMSR